MTRTEARKLGWDVFFFTREEDRTAFAAGLPAGMQPVPFNETVHGFELLCLAISPRTNTTTKGQKEWSAYACPD